MLHLDKILQYCRFELISGNFAIDPECVDLEFIIFLLILCIFGILTQILGFWKREPVCS